MEKLKHAIKSQQFSQELMIYLFQLADDMRNNPEKYSTILQGKRMVAWFYEPSTRTRMSFSSAMLKLGGAVIGTDNAEEFSSSVKGETFEDSIRILQPYGDVLVLRHKKEGASELAAELSNISIINAGDGKGQHPTQALLDMYTIYREFGRLNDLKIAIVGDLANGRTVRSLAYLSSKFKNLSLKFVCPAGLEIGYDIKAHLVEHHVPYVETNEISAVLSECDVIYMTRIQKERITEDIYNNAKGKYIINEKNLKLIKKEARILHPLPHVEEISLPITIEKNDKRIAYFRQAENGLYLRMALLVYLLLE